MIEIPRSVLEATAHVLGPASAAARALADADAHDGMSTFFSYGTTILVRKQALAVGNLN